VRHLFQGEIIGIWRHTSQPEIWSYSAAWLVLGLLFLAYGIWRGTREPRLASAALVFLAVIKVFLKRCPDRHRARLPAADLRPPARRAAAGLRAAIHLKGHATARASLRTSTSI
jgi:hypothetical protein